MPHVVSKPVWRGVPAVLPVCHTWLKFWGSCPEETHLHRLVKVLGRSLALLWTFKSMPYLEMLLQQAIVMELSGGQILSKYRSVTSVRRTQPLTSSSRKYWDPLVRYWTAISVIWGRGRKMKKKGMKWQEERQFLQLDNIKCLSNVHVYTLKQPTIRSATRPLQ